ncbi:MAG TPA: uroporphyrinogen-III synthase [Bryobacteraceae bacterium]|nr:uroporphyrinogen-III synthase [Bryobacteraceae bacterium]
MSFDGLRVFAFESRRAAEMAHLIRNRQGEPFVAPSMREVPLEENQEAFRFAERLFAGDFDMVILLTGVGTRLLQKTLAARYPAERFREALGRVTLVARGPKPVAALREMNLAPAITAPEPNTWRELLSAVEGRPERRIAVQEYGRSNPELLDGLRARGAEVTPVRVYGWDLPEDTGPLREAVRRIAAGEADVAMFTTAMQVVHLFRVAEESGVAMPAFEAGLTRAVIGSIGPTTSEALEEHGLRPDLEPSHPRMGFLVQETAARAREILAAKSVRR